MRLDIFLKQTGLVKRRTVAKAMCDAGKIQRNGHVAKPADEVRMDDKLTIDYGIRAIDVSILSVPTGSVGKAKREEYFQITREHRDEDW